MAGHPFPLQFRGVQLVASLAGWRHVLAPMRARLTRILRHDWFLLPNHINSLFYRLYLCLSTRQIDLSEPLVLIEPYRFPHGVYSRRSRCIS